METKDLIDLHGTKNGNCKSESNVACDLGFELCDSETQLAKPEVIVQQGQPNGSVLARNSNQISSVRQATVKLSETPAVEENSKCLSPGIETDNECSTAANGSPVGKRKRDGDNEIHGSSISTAKKARTTVDEDKPIVHVKYGSLTRKSKQKLEELLHQWSEWHTQHCSPTHDSDEIRESGEGIYFPALRVGVGNSSAVTFWMDNPLRDQHSGEVIAVDSKTAPLYDRGYSLEGDSKKLDAFRCFNCGSYSHPLTDCPKPRDNVAINNARTQHQSNHNQKSSSNRAPTRYYQNSHGGKYDGLVPGALQAETRGLLGLGELDPPPWLHRMREIGYPPGYLDPDDDDQPSGITIFTDEEKMEENENKDKSLKKDRPQPSRKMSVQFPGMNAPIPEKADERKWARPSTLDLSISVSFPRPNYQSQPNTVSPYNNQRWHGDDLTPPGCDPSLSPRPFSFSPMYAHQNINIFPTLGSPTFQSRPLDYGGYPHSNSHVSPYLPGNGGLFSQNNYGNFGYKRQYR